MIVKSAPSGKESEYMDGYNQVFILGAPRSGTTFLASLLEHSSYGAPFETHFIPKYLRKLDSYGRLDERQNFKALLSDILSERPVQQWKLEVNLDDFYDRLDPDFSYSNIINTLISTKRGGKPHWGDKTPNYLENPEILNTLFPKAKYIFIIRDGRDVALSLLKKPWGPNTIMACGDYWSRLNRNYLRFSRKLQKESIYALRYEDLLKDTEHHIRSIYDFLGENITEDRVRRLAASVKGDNSGKWQSQLSQKQLRIFEAKAEDQLKQFDYPVLTESPRISWLERNHFLLYEKYKRFIFLFNTNVVDGIKIRFFGKEPFNE